MREKGKTGALLMPIVADSVAVRLTQKNIITFTSPLAIHVKIVSIKSVKNYIQFLQGFAGNW